MRFDAWLTSVWVNQSWQAERDVHRYRWIVAALVVVFSCLDLYLTQTILTLVEHATGDAPSEANPIMAPIVLSWWAWPVRVGIPILAVLRDIRKQNYHLMLFAVALYGCVCIWNTHVYTTIT
jgi:hypothetical protein